jgi:carboxylesterase type B
MICIWRCGSSADVASYHDKWDNVTVARIEANYPRDFYRTEAYRLTRVGTDFCFRCDTRRAARALSRAGLDVYLYNFAYHFNTWRDPQSDKCQEDSEALCGVYHAAELRFVFDNYQFPLAEEDKEMAATIGALWSSFAKTGKPEVPSRFNTTDDVEWPLYNASSDRHLEINLPLTVHAGLSKAHCDLFEALPPEGPYPH